MAKDKYEVLNIDETQYNTLYTAKYKNRKTWTAPDPKKVISFIPGTILDILVKKGQEVKEGEVLLLLEAMKMRNKIVAPMDGKIAAIHVKKTQIVPKNALLIEFK